MKHPYRTVLILLFIACFLRPGNSCGPFFETDTFVLQNDPDPPYRKFVAGRLGLVQSEYRIRHMVVAYNTLSGRGLSAAEQKAAVDVDTFYNTPDYQQAPGVGERKVPGDDWQTFPNCLADAKANADRTLADRRARYGKPGSPDTAEIEDWKAGQDAVFSNCAGPGSMPHAAAANAPLWLKQDRAYQIAAAQFYALDYDNALASFRAIANDHGSPWAPLARYLVARTLIRKATVPYRPFYINTPQPTPQQVEADKGAVRAGLGEARDQLEGILYDPAMKSMHEASRHLLDYVMARLDPGAQANELARRLTMTKSADDDAAARDYRQNVIDLSFIYNSLPSYASGTPYQAAKAQAQSPLIRWLNDMGHFSPAVAGEAAPKNAADRGAERRADALALWRAEHGPQWLVAALAIAEPGQAENAELIAAAHAVPVTSPAYATVTYHRLRLESTPAKAAEAMDSNTKPIYEELAGLMPGIEKAQPLSTVNALEDIESRLAPTLNDFLHDATRIAAGIGDEDEGGTESVPPETGPNPETLCGVHVNAPDARHLDEETALIFNERMPLRMLRDAALSAALPANVRFEVAHMAWTRAVLLDDAATARALTPYLSGCQPAMGSWLKQYDAATTGDERRVLGLLALMRFTSADPMVHAGAERDFAAYSEYRDNWWCSLSAERLGSSQRGPQQPHLFEAEIVPRLKQPDPPFLMAADRAAVEQEMSRLEVIPCASDYFAQQTLAWVKEHPGDPHNADLIGFAMRVVRNACRNDDTKELNHQLFDLIHKRYPNSEWAKRYTTWE